jgi:hypothetical protein
MTAGIATLLGPGRRYFLFDSFVGLPPAKGIDGDEALKWQSANESSGYYDNCCAPPEFAKQAMMIAQVPSFQLIEGWFSDTLPKFTPPEPIALLRLDGDWYESTTTCLEHLYSHVTHGGIVILDDYHTWDGCTRALHDFLSKRSATDRVQSFGQICFLVKGNGASLSSRV